MFTLIATGAYGRRANATDWIKGLYFRMRAGGPYFSIRDKELLRSKYGYREILFCDAFTSAILFKVTL